MRKSVHLSQAAHKGWQLSGWKCNYLWADEKSTLLTRLLHSRQQAANQMQLGVSSIVAVTFDNQNVLEHKQAYCYLNSIFV